MTSPISVIIPTLNEETHLADLLNSLQAHQGLEIIVSDGGSTDRTLEVADNANVTVVRSQPGRGLQQNNGAQIASHGTLVFLHSDTRLPDDFQNIVNSILSKPGIVAGAFRLKIDNISFAYRLIEWGVKIRSSLLSTPYGDQAFFMKKRIFEQVGGFPDQLLLEDLELVRKLHRIGKIQIAPASVLTSDRRWQRRGALRTTLLNQLILIAYFSGISPAKLNRLYYGKKEE